jgi:hypothetical protein
MSLSPNTVIVNLKGPKLPTSGSEPRYDPQRWYKKPGMCGRHNCLAYALNLTHQSKSMYLQLSSDLGGSDTLLSLTRGLKGKQLKTQQCLLSGLFFHRLYPKSYLVTPETACKRNFYKIALLNSAPRVSRGGRKRNYDFHFVRQNANGLWSHKPGGTPITRYNARGDLIKDPRTASWNYGSLKYKPCSFFCVPRHARHTTGARKGTS